MNRNDRIRTSIIMILLSVLILGVGIFLGLHNRSLRRQLADDQKLVEKGEKTLTELENMDSKMNTMNREIEQQEAENQRKREEQETQLKENRMTPEKLKDLPADQIVEAANLQDPDGNLWEELWGAYFASYEIQPEETDSVYARILGKSYPGTDSAQVEITSLKFVRVLHYDFNDQICVGELIVGADFAEEYINVFKELFAQKYQIRSMKLIDDFWEEGDNAFTADQKSIAADNTTCFNYRTQKPQGTSENLSGHASGLAIDVNPLENPDVRDGASVETAEECQDYVDRANAPNDPHMINENDVCWTAFTNNGFSWAGAAEEGKTSFEYQHFSVN
ncbi:MAG: M15 family metallopeptidase [Eubacteriales bacterium]|nr:M15 family metallopeptidase [Eubacteriales bacterium]